MKKVLTMICLLLSVFALGACSAEKQFVGTWTADLFDQGTTREDASKVVGKLYGGGIWNDLASAIAGDIHYNVTMDIKEDGTLTMDSGMKFDATWKREGDKIIIEGDNIAGTATLSEDQKTLYFENTIGEETTSSNGLSFGSSSITFEFRRAE